jgi:hypothetical protein
MSTSAHVDCRVAIGEPAILAEQLLTVAGRISCCFLSETGHFLARHLLRSAFWLGERRLNRFVLSAEAPTRDATHQLVSCSLTLP